MPVEQAAGVGRTLVLGGGGVAGIAWTTGLHLGLSETGVTLDDADLIIGTSAGATVAAQFDAGLPLAELFARQVDPARQPVEPAPDLALYADFMKTLLALVAQGDTDRLVLGMGELARAARTVDVATRRAAVAARLPSHDWPARPLRLVALDVQSGATRLFDSGAGVGLVDAVAASCAVPGVWPPVPVRQRRYMDGGVRSIENADLASGCERALIVSPTGAQAPHLPGRGLLDQVRFLEGNAARVFVVEPDEPSRKAAGVNPLAPETRSGSAQAGRSQGNAVAAKVGAFWG